MSDLNLTELRKVAEAATPGPWEVLAYDSGLSYRELNAVVITEDLGDRICDTDAPSHGYDGPHAAEGLDARHIATFDPPTVLALLDRVAELEGKHRDLTSRIGFGDNITEPMADNDTIVEFIETVTMEADEHRECPIICELCGERLADTDCSHCHGSGGNLAAIAKSGAYAECEWCAGAGKVHEGCVEKSYADLAARVAETEGTVARVEALVGVYGPSYGGARISVVDVRAALAGDA